MMLEEMQSRLKKSTIETQEQLWQIIPIYCLLDFSKDDFCKLIDAVGIDKWLAKSEQWERLDRAERDLSAKERYNQAKVRIKAIEFEMKDRQHELEELDELCNRYEQQ